MVIDAVGEDKVKDERRKSLSLPTYTIPIHILNLSLNYELFTDNGYIVHESIRQLAHLDSWVETMDAGLQEKKTSCGHRRKVCVDTFTGQGKKANQESRLNPIFVHVWDTVELYCQLTKLRTIRIRTENDNSYIS